MYAPDWFFKHNVHFWAWSWQNCLILWYNSQTVRFGLSAGSALLVTKCCAQHLLSVICRGVCYLRDLLGVSCRICYLVSAGFAAGFCRICYLQDSAGSAICRILQDLLSAGSAGSATWGICYLQDLLGAWRICYLQDLLGGICRICCMLWEACCGFSMVSWNYIRSGELEKQDTARWRL